MQFSMLTLSGWLDNFPVCIEDPAGSFVLLAPSWNTRIFTKKSNVIEKLTVDKIVWYFIAVLSEIKGMFQITILGKGRRPKLDKLQTQYNMIDWMLVHNATPNWLGCIIICVQVVVPDEAEIPRVPGWKKWPS